MTVLIRTARRFVVCLATLASLTIGCGGSSEGAGGDGGTAGTGGTGGTGGARSVTVALPECSVEGYDALWRDFWTNGLHVVLGFVDATVDPPRPAFDTREWGPPPQSILPPIEDLSDPEKKKPRVVWKTFCWGDWRADFYEALNESFYETNPIFNLKNGFFNSTVAVVDWRGISDDEALPGCNFDNEEPQDASFLAKGTFSVVGLDNDVVRVTLVKFPECAPLPQEEPLRDDEPKLCADPEDPNDPYNDPEYNDNPWWGVPPKDEPEDDTECSFELTSLSMQVDISATIPQRPSGVIIEFRARIPGHSIESGLITVGADGVVSFTGTYDGQPASFDFDRDAEELTIRFPAAPETRCDVDTTDGIEVVDCE